jgi:hypothetical protein
MKKKSEVGVKEKEKGVNQSKIENPRRVTKKVPTKLGNSRCDDIGV